MEYKNDLYFRAGLRILDMAVFLGKRYEIRSRMAVGQDAENGV